MGKSRLANQITEGKKVCTINGRNNIFRGNFPFFMVEECVEFIIFDDFDFKKNNIEFLYSILDNGLIIDRKSKAPFKCNPAIIITTNERFESLPCTLSFVNRFTAYEIIRCK